MEQERSAQRARERASVPMAAASDFVVPEGTDELSRSTRRAWRDRLNDAQARKMALGTLAAFAGGTFWGFSGTSASYLFDVCHIETFWLMSVRQVIAGLLFMFVVLKKDRVRLVKLWTTPADRKQLILFTIFGLLFNQLCYLSAVRLTNAGTATVFQCLQLVVVMGYACVTAHRLPRTREALGILLALGGTFLIATGGDPSTLSISPMGLLAGLFVRSGRCLHSNHPGGNPQQIRQPGRHGLGHAFGGNRDEYLYPAVGAHAGARPLGCRRARGVYRDWVVLRLYVLHAGR